MRRAALALALLGCNAREQLQTSDESSTSGDASSTSTTTSFPWPLPPSDDGASYSIIEEPDVGGRPCDVWSQDCPPGEKCTAYADEGDEWWNNTRCTPIPPEPKSVGEPCTVVGAMASGDDDCERGAMCWWIDEATNTGECVGFCQGSEANPFCADPCATCVVGDTVLSICVESCDPLLQDCGEGEGCYAAVDVFWCAPDMSGRGGAAGESCDFITKCDPGLVCMNGELVPGCEGKGCCTPFCDVYLNDECDAVIPGSSCFEWWDSAVGVQSCFGTSRLGFCAVPP